MELILIRHGESEANAANGDKDRFFIGQLDCDLTEKGREQAMKLKNDPILAGADAFYCSDLKRTVETAGLLTDGRVIADKRLRERCIGLFEGEMIEKVRNDPRYSAYFSDPAFMNFRHGFSARAPQGENYCDVCDRVNSFLNDLDRSLKKVVIVSHFCAIRCIIKEVNCLSEEETLKLKIYNCQPIMVNFEK